MPYALLLGLISVAGGTLATYLYGREMSFGARLCAGAPTGLAALGLMGLILASLLGMTPLALILAAGTVALPPLLWLRKDDRRAQVGADLAAAARGARRALLHPDRQTILIAAFYAAALLLLWLVFGRAMFETAEGIFTGVDNNLGDLPLHIGIITGFTFGDNFPPQHPEYAGVRLTYPFMVDFVAAMFVRAGASLEGALFWQNMVLGISLVGLSHRWALKLTRDQAAALISTALLFLSGGFGWWLLFQEAHTGERGLLDLLARLPHDYTINTPDQAYRWGNTVTTLLVPQRAMLFGLPLALLVWTLWWQAIAEEAAAAAEARPAVDARRTRRKKNARDMAASAHPDTPVLVATPLRFMLAAGGVAGLMPLVHAHSFMVMAAMGGCLALLFPKFWREWIAFFAVALALAAPQMFWATRESAMRAESFVGWHIGWHRGDQNPLWFWLNNTGLFIPLLAAALAWRGGRQGRAPLVPRPLLLFFLPFTLCFVVPNLLRLSPWVWDNVKFLFYWYVASVPLVALLLARLWRAAPPAPSWRAVAAVLLFVVLTLAGSLDIWRVISRASTQRLFDREAIEFAEMIKDQTPPRARILHAPEFNHAVFLSGRRSLMGYDGHLWTHGIDYLQREKDIVRIYAGGDVDSLLRQYAVDYIVVGPPERDSDKIKVNELFLEQFQKVGEVGAYSLYKTARR